jgi:hypothetical protein
MAIACAGAAHAAGCADDYKSCKDNADVANNYLEYRNARSACTAALAKSVRFGEPTYRDGRPFMSFLVGDEAVKTGRATLVSRVALQNGSGAAENGEQNCEYDLQTKQVIKLYGSLNKLGGYWAPPNYTALNAEIEARATFKAAAVDPSAAAMIKPPLNFDPAVHNYKSGSSGIYQYEGEVAGEKNLVTVTYFGRDPRGQHQIGAKRDDKTIDLYLCKEPCESLTVQVVDRTGAILAESTVPMPPQSMVRAMMRDAMAGKLQVSAPTRK